jgi:hypothetical protein
MTDEGFWGCFYQQIFKGAEGLQYNFDCWFTGVVGGAWNCLWPSGGLLGFRLLGVLVLCATMVMSASILRPYVDRRVLSLSLLMCGLLQHSMVNIFYEKSWCGFLAVCIVYCLHRGLVHRKGGWLFVGGAVASLAALSRIPSVALMGLGACILFYGYIRAMSIRDCVLSVGWFVFGSVAGFGVLFGCMALLGHVGIFVDALRFTFELASDTSGDAAHHGWKTLLLSQRGFLTSVAMLGGVICGFVTATTLAVFYLRQSPLRSSIRRAGVYAAQAGLVLGVLYIARSSMTSVAVLVFFCSLVLLVAVSRWANPEPDRRLLCFLALGVVILLPLGSDVLLGMLRYALWLALPIAVDTALRLLRDVRFQVSVETPTHPDVPKWSLESRLCFPELKRMLAVCFATLVALNAWLWWGGVYRDAGGRLNMRAQIQSPAVRGVFTSRERCAALNEVLSQLRHYVSKGDELLVFANMPMLHMLTETRPYQGLSWVKLLSSGQLSSALANATSKSQTLPVVVVHKRNVGLGTWPVQAAPYSIASNIAGQYAVLREFMTKHGYACAWENDDFSVWTPSRR